MKPLKQQVKVIFGLGLILLYLTGKAQSPDQAATPTIEEKSYEIGTYMGANRVVNLMVKVRQANGVTIKIKNAEDETLHEFYLKNSPRAYHHRLNFADSRAGQYKLEISDGRTTLTRWIEVVDVPAIEGQRYITFTSPSNQ